MMVRFINSSETLFYSHWKGKFCQWLDVSLENAAATDTAVNVTITAGQNQIDTEVVIRPGKGIYRVYAPASWQDPELHAKLELSPLPAGTPDQNIGQFDDIEALSATISIGHFRPWTVYLLSDVCTDYTWVYADERSMRADDAALMYEELLLAEETQDEPDENRNRYNLVHTRQVEFFLERFPELENRLFTQFRNGTFTLNPIFNMSLTGDMSVETFLRSLYPARRLARQFNLNNRYANLQETPTITWGVASLLAGSGIKHLARGILPYECPWAKRIQEPPVYIWDGADGSQLQVRLRNQDYVEGRFVLHGLLATNQALHEKILLEYENLPIPYPFNAIALLGCYGDLSPESSSLPARKTATIHAYNSQGWEYPRLINATHQQFWDDIDRQIQFKGTSLPIVRGDYGSSWDAWPTSLAHDFAGWRRAQERAATADRLMAILSQLDPKFYEDQHEKLEEAWKYVISLGDHAWNGANDDNRKLNLELRRGWQTKANAILDEVLSLGLECITTNVTSGETTDLLVFNPLGWIRTALTSLTLPELPEAVQNLANGEIVPVQRVNEQEGCFLATDVPSIGYRIFRPVHLPAKKKNHPLKASRDSKKIESAFYSLEISDENGGISSLYDKTRQRELVDAGSLYTLNEPVFFSADQPSLPPAAYELFGPIDLTGMTEKRAKLISAEITSFGPVFVELRTLSAIGDIQFTSSYRLFTDLDQIDICNEIYKPITSEKQELDFIFPFNVPNRSYRVEAPGVIINPDQDRLPGAGQAFTCLRHFVDVFNRDYGIRLAMAESGVIEFGQRTTGDDPVMPDPENATILVVALQNCIDWNESIHDQGGISNFTFRFSLQGHPGGFNPTETVHFGWQSNNELITGMISPYQNGILPFGEHSFLSVTPSNAILTGFKRVESEGLLARFWECSGEQTLGKIQLNGLGEISRSDQTDLLEEVLKPISSSTDQFFLPLPSRGFAAARLVMKANAD